MYVGKTLFVQVMEFVPWTSFVRIVQRNGGNAGVRTLSCAEQFRAMAFAQLTWRESLHDIENSLSANADKLYAMGFRSADKRSTLAEANESRLAHLVVPGGLADPPRAQTLCERGCLWVVSASPTSRTADAQPASDVDQGSKTVSDCFGERARLGGRRPTAAVL